LVVADFPVLHAIRDVKGLPHLFFVEVFCEERCGACGVTAEIEFVLNLGSVLLKSQILVIFKDSSLITFV
jgi:hypothetical protein